MQGGGHTITSSLSVAAVSGAAMLPCAVGAAAPAPVTRGEGRRRRAAKDPVGRAAMELITRYMKGGPAAAGCVPRGAPQRRRLRGDPWDTLMPRPFVAHPPAQRAHSEMSTGGHVADGGAIGSARGVLGLLCQRIDIEGRGSVGWAFLQQCACAGVHLY